HSMKKVIKPLFLFFALSIALLIPNQLYTCGSFPTGEEFRYTIFEANTADLQQYRPFYFTTNFLNDGTSTLIKMGINQNLQEWSTYFNEEVKVKDIQDFLYDYTFSALDTRSANIEEVKNKDIYKYSLVKFLVTKEDKATLDYILYSKEVEDVLKIGGPWTDDELAKPTLQKLIDHAKITYPSVNSTLQLRYAYQMVVLARYLESYEQAVKLYAEYIAPLQSESIVRYWGMMHKATALHHIGKEAEADYNFAMGFKNAPNKRHRAYLGFEGKNMEKSLQFAKTKEEKAALWLMKGVKSPGKAFEAISKMYAFAPNMPELNLLLTREINKIEDWILTPAYTGFQSASSYSFYFEDANEQNKKNDKKYLEQILNFVEQSILKNNVHDIAFWNLAAGYLSFMDDNYLKANNYLQQAEIANDTSKAIQNQVHLTRIMAFTNDYGGISEGAEKQLFESIKWLQKEYPTKKKGKNDYYHINTTFEKVMQALAARYEKNDEFPKAAMYISQIPYLMRAPTKEFIGDVYGNYFFYLNEFASTENLQKLLKTIDKKNKSPYEQFLSQKIAADKNKILDLLGTMYLRQDKLKKSLAIFQQIPNEYWKGDTFRYKTYLNANPFYANFYSGHTPTIGDTIRYTKPEFVSEMLSLKAIAAEGGLDESACNLLIANGYYNMTFYGNSWMMVRYWATNSWEYDVNRRKNHYDDIAHFYGCTRAKQFYVKAAETASKCSFAALCYRMAGKCEYRQEILEHTLAAENIWDAERPEFKDNSYYQLLKNNFGEYYDRLIDDCTSFNDFIAWGD
ncbi:MAG: hypothetical protein ACPG49_07285, partial [Chitinophagales bacterium]